MTLQRYWINWVRETEEPYEAGQVVTPDNEWVKASDAEQALLTQEQALLTKDAEIARLRTTLEFYANGKHIIHYQPTCFVDGKPAGNGWYSYERGQVAKRALEEQDANNPR